MKLIIKVNCCKSDVNVWLNNDKVLKPMSIFKHIEKHLHVNSGQNKERGILDGYFGIARG